MTRFLTFQYFFLNTYISMLSIRVLVILKLCLCYLQVYIYLVDKRTETLLPMVFSCEPFFFFHVVNAHQQGSDKYVVLDLLAYKDAEASVSVYSLSCLFFGYEYILTVNPFVSIKSHCQIDQVASIDHRDVIFLPRPIKRYIRNRLEKYPTRHELLGLEYHRAFQLLLYCISLLAE